MRLILVRHGETRWNEERRIQGIGDTELNERGRKQTQYLAQALASENVVAIYSSPLSRALKTARAIARPHNLEVQIEDALKELDAGELDGLTTSEIAAQYGDFLKEWIKGSPTLKMPGGESIAELRDRAWEVIERIIKRYPDGVVIVVSHYFVILAIICQALNLDLVHYRRFRHDVAAISILDFGERGASLLLLNDTCHLEKMAAS